MKLRRKLILPAPGEACTGALQVVAMVNHQSVELAREQRDVIEPARLAGKQDELGS